MKLIYFTSLTLLLSFCTTKSKKYEESQTQNTITQSQTRKSAESDTNVVEKDQKLIAEKISRKKDLTILDYYLALPDHYFFGCKSYKGKRYWGEITEKQRLSYVKHKNILNGFLTVQIPREATLLQVALFTYQDMKIIAVFEDAGSMWQCTIRDFLSLEKNGIWKKLNIELPINYSNDQIKQIEAGLKKKSGERPLDRKVQLPEFGTDLQVIEVSTETPLFKIAWQEGKFRVKE